MCERLVNHNLIRKEDKDLMAKQPGPGRCVHCGDYVEKRTWDHVFPKGWYPEDSPTDIEKWKIPSCKKCNSEYGSLEEDLGIRIVFCIGPDAQNAKGIYRKALRSMDASKGRKMKDRILRAKKRDRYLELIMKGNIPQEGIYPGFEDKWNRPREDQTAIRIYVHELERIVNKIIKGIVFIEDNRFLDASTEIEHLVVSDEAAKPLEELLHKYGSRHEREPGIEVIRAVAPEDGVSALYKISIWKQWVLYASVSQLSTL